MISYFYLILKLSLTILIREYLYNLNSFMSKNTLNVLSTLSFIGLSLLFLAEWASEKIGIDKWGLFYFGAALITINALAILIQAFLNKKNKK